MGTRRNWAVVGRLASIVLGKPSRTGHSILVQEHELARQLGLSRGTLRNYRDAVRLVRSVSEPELRRALFRLTGAAAAQMVRWLRKDYREASHFLFRNPAAGLSQVLAAQATSAKRAGSRGWQRLPTVEHALGGGSVLRPLLHYTLANTLVERQLVMSDRGLALLPDTLKPASSNHDRFLRIDWLLTLSNVTSGASGAAFSSGSPACAAVLEMGRFQLLDQYAIEARAIWARSVAAAAAYPLVIALFPGPSARRRFLTELPPGFLAKGASAGTFVDSYHRDVPLSATSFAPGCIVFTTRLNAVRDLLAVPGGEHQQQPIIDC